MEEEIKCPFCRKIFNTPVMLPCFHNACLNCALNYQQAYHSVSGDLESHRQSTTCSSIGEESLPPLLPPPPPTLSSIAGIESVLTSSTSTLITTSSTPTPTPPPPPPSSTSSSICKITTTAITHPTPPTLSQVGGNYCAQLSNSINPSSTTIATTNNPTAGSTATINKCPANNQIRDGSICSSSSSSETSDADKLSIISETDSGVMCCSLNSRPNSYLSSTNLGSILFPSSSSSTSSNGSLNASNGVYFLQCPICHKFAYMDDLGAHSLPKNRTLNNIIARYEENKRCSLLCQLCESSAKQATILCEQCDILYCDQCKEHFHPLRGPLAKHNLIAADSVHNLTSRKSKTKSKEWSLKCLEHGDMPLTNFCLVCKIPICDSCNQDNRHSNHNVHSLAIMCKSQKVSN